MSRLKGLLRQLRTLFRKEAVDREQREEIAFHIEMQTQEFIRRGMSAAEARRAAHVAFGGVERYREARQQASWVRVIEETVADIGYTLRSLRRRPGFAAAVAVTLGLGVGGTTAIFSVVDGLFLRAPAGVRQADALRRIYIQRDEGDIRSGIGGASGSFVDYAVLRDGLRGATSVASFLSPRLDDLGSGVDAEQVRLGVVSQSYFGTLGVRPAAGRFFLPEEDTPAGAGTGVVVSHGFAERRLGGADAVLGETLRVNRQTLTVLGVAEKGFTGLDATPVDLWVPNHSAPLLGLLTPRSFETVLVVGMVHLVVRLSDGTDAAALEWEATTVLTHAAEQYAMLDPTPLALSSSLVPAAGPHRSSAADLSLWLGIVALLVLVIACANVANLLLARGMTRRRELAVRASLGATRGRVARQHLVESMTLALLGGVTGI
ncbi:MAG: ABC transporter permease, partial [Chloroflexota bacterium]